MPVSYEGSQALKCNVAFNFIRYVSEKKSWLVSSGVGDQGNVLLNREPIRDITRGASDLLGINANVG